MPVCFPPAEQKQIIEALKPLIHSLDSYYKTLTSSNPQLTRLLEYIEQHYSQKIASKDVCQYMFMSASTLNRFLRNETGRSLISLLHHIRIQHAVELLQTTTDSVINIGYSVGFETQKSFFTIFKRITGMSPKEFRNRNHNL
jgi:AraC-type DNA-binding domain-containing proteins